VIVTIRILAINESGDIVEKSDLLNGFEQNLYNWTWVDFSEPTTEEEQLLETFFHFHHLAVEDCLHGLQRPKMDHFDEVHFLVLHAIESSTSETREITMFICPKLLVTFHKEPSAELDAVRNVFMRNPEIRKRGLIYLSYYIMDQLVDEYFPCMSQISEQMDEIEMQETSEPSRDIMRELFALRGQLLKLRRTVMPMRDLLYRIVNTQKIEGLAEHLHYFRDVHDHLIRLSEKIEANRELTADLRENFLSINSYRMNSIMKTLTVFTTIFMPLTFIVGLYGMNFHNMPELKWQWGYFLVLGIMGLIGFGMLLWFRNKRWFD
jgi:magnesium transporter